MNNWRILRQFFVEKGLEIVFIALFIPLLLGAVTVLVKDRWFLYLLLSVAVVAAYLALVAVREKRARRKSLPNVGLAGALDIPRRGVVFTLGLHSDKPMSVLSIVIEKVKPDFIGFLGTPETESGGAVKNICAAQGLGPGRCKSEFWDPTEVSEGKTKAGLVIDWMLKQGVSERELVVDLTGGTATMSVAAFMAADERRIDCQYITSKFDSVTNERIRGFEKAILLTSYEAAPKATPTNNSSGVVAGSENHQPENLPQTG